MRCGQYDGSAFGLCRVQTEKEFDQFADQLAARFARRAFATNIGTHIIKPTYGLLEGIAKNLGGEDPIVEVGLALGRSRLEPTPSGLSAGR